MLLKHPIQVSESKTVTELRFPEKPLALHFKGVSLPDVFAQKTEAWLRVVSNMTGEPMVVLEKMHFTDTLQALEELLGFLGFSSQTPSGGDEKSEESPKPS